jgi:Ca2+-binding RTX toxin-like protein
MVAGMGDPLMIYEYDVEVNITFSMANTDVSTDLALRNAIQAAGSSDSVTLLGSTTDGYSVLTLAKRSSFTSNVATPFSGYTVQGTSTTLSSSAKLVNTRIYQQNVDGPLAPGLVKDLTLNYTTAGAADGGALLSFGSTASRSITLNNIKITGVHRGWNGNGNLYMSLRSFNAAVPLNTSFTMTGVTVDITGQNNSFNGTTGGSAFLHSWNNAGTVSISGSSFDEKGFASTLNLLNYNTPHGSYTITGNTFFRSGSATVRPEGNRLQNVTATLVGNTFSNGSYLDLYGSVGSISLNGTTTANTFNTIGGGFGIRMTTNGVALTGTPTITGSNVFTGGGLALKFVNAASGSRSLTTTGTFTVNGSTFINLFAGGQASDTIVGNSTANWISGDTGNDTLTGGAGDDAFVFATALNASTNVDTLTDFTRNGQVDRIWLANSVFTGLATGTLDAGDFGTTASFGTDVVYDSITKGIFFAAGGAGTLAGYTKFATLNGTSTNPLLNTDFFVF